MYIGHHVKHPLFLSDFNDTWTFTTDFRKIRKYQLSWISVQCQPICSMPMTHTHTHTHTHIPHTHKHTNTRTHTHTHTHTDGQRVINDECCILSFGWFPTPEFYVPTFRNTLSFPTLYICDRSTRKSVPKLRHIKFRRWGITQKKEYNGRDEGNNRFSQFRLGV
jgi:hypothetical protein